MSPKWTFLAHFGDISYNVFNRRKSSFFYHKTLDFTISCRMDHFSESNHQKLIFFVYFSLFTKLHLSGFGVTKYRKVIHILMATFHIQTRAISKAYNSLSFCVKCSSYSNCLYITFLLSSMLH